MSVLSEIKANTTPVITGLKEFDLEARLPISLIRTHTKTDDVPHVTDEQLRLYRDAAFEAAELYTGLLFRRQRQITEETSTDYSARTLRRGYYTHRLKYPSADGLVYLYGTRNGTRSFNVEPGERLVRIPVTHWAIDADPCCAPRCSGALNHGQRLMYRAGYSCTDDIPQGIIVGVLKFIAWLITNPGDEIMTVRNRLAGDSAGIIGTNNGAWASGAIEQWRMYVSEP